MVERISKLIKLEKAPSKTTEKVKIALVDRLGPVQEFVITAVSDNEKELTYLHMQG